MKTNHNSNPDYLFEVSWEVCNKVGGIYTVISTKARQIEQLYGDHYLCIGPDLNPTESNADFVEEPSHALSAWVEYARTEEQLAIRLGRWNIPGHPLVLLVDFRSYMERRNAIYGDMWQWFGVNSLPAYGDYHEGCMFAYAAGEVIHSFSRYFKLEDKAVVAQFHEWTTSFGLLYCKHFMPNVATLFTTHATSIGRSIAGNGKPLYDYLLDYNGDQMAEELNMVSKHSAEKTAAHQAHCFTTVSDITNRECKQLLEKAADVVTPNGFEDDFVPKAAQKTQKKKRAKQLLKSVAERVTGTSVSDDAVYVATSGRYEFKNKGIDLFIESLAELNGRNPEQEVVDYILVPAWNAGARQDLMPGFTPEASNRVTTHYLMEPEKDPVMQTLNRVGLFNHPDQKVKVIFVPTYLSGTDGIFNVPYYDLLIGFDLTLFPSYYEPWGYTPMESAAFSIPTITTDLAGFGQWVSHEPQPVSAGVAVLHRSDYDSALLNREMADNLQHYINADKTQRQQMARKAGAIAKKAHWKEFIVYYQEAFALALGKLAE